MHRLPRLAAIGAAIIAVLAVGSIVFFGGTRNLTVGGGATISPSPRATPLATPTTAPSTTMSKYETPLGVAIVGLDGTVRQELGLPPDAWAPNLSTDGQKVIFVTRSKDVIHCYGCAPGPTPVVMTVGQSSGDYICCNVSGFAQAAWSPDGKSVAYQVAGKDGNLDIYVVPFDPQGSGISLAHETRLTSDAAADGWPAWSPDGKTIYYVNDGAETAQTVEAGGFSPTQEIWRVSAAGGTPQRLTDNAVSDLQPDVARDGTVAYWEDGSIMTMAADGTDQRRLAAIPLDTGFNPRWSPDGSRIALLQYDPTDPNGHPDMDPALGWPPELPLLQVVVADPVTGEVTTAGPRVASFYNPVSWTPDGTALLMNRYDDGTP